MHEQEHHTGEHRSHAHHAHHRQHEHHHMHHHHHHHALFHRFMPHVRRMFHEMGHTNMNPRHLDHMTDRILHESGVIHDMPPGHTRETMGDFVRFLILALIDGMVADPQDPPDWRPAFADGQHEPAAEAFNPFLPFVFGPWFPFYPFSFFPHHPHFHPRRRPHHGRPPGRPPHGGGHRPR